MILGTSVRTSLIGYLGAVALAIIPLLQAGKIEPKTWILAIVIALLGRFSKDADQYGPGS
jgi:hypothetical protein